VADKNALAVTDDIIKNLSPARETPLDLNFNANEDDD
jgi:hypothetical protein